MQKEQWISSFVKQVAVPLLQNCKKPVTTKSGLKINKNFMNLILGETEEQWVNLRPMKGYRPGLAELMAYLNSDKAYWSRQIQLIEGYKRLADTEKEFYDSLLLDKGERNIDLMARLDNRYTAWENIHSLIKSMAKSLKAQLENGNKVFLLGRDVWPWVPIFVQMDVPFYFDSRVSRQIVNTFGNRDKEDAYLRLLFEADIRNGDIVFDTGFAGTIFKRTKEISGRDLKCVMMSADRSTEQIYPNLGLARPYVLNIEYLTKPFKTGRYEMRSYSSDETEVIQELGSTANIFIWILNTIGLWYLESPKILQNSRNAMLSRSPAFTPANYMPDYTYG